MPVIQTPGIWDYIGQGLGDAAHTYYSIKQDQQAQKDREQADAERQAQMLMQMVQSGAVDSDTANQSPVAQKFGFKFQPSEAELRRKIASSPTPTAQVPAAMTGAGGMAGSNITIPTGPPGSQFSDAAHQAAGLPTAGATVAASNNERLQSTLDALKQRYITAGASSMKPEELAAIGQKTTEEADAERRSKIDPVVGAAAQRYASGVFNTTIANLKVDPLTAAGMAAIRRQAPTMAAAAYQQYLKDSQAAGSEVATTPQDKQYTKSFFDAAISDQITDAQKERAKQALAEKGKQGDTPVQWYNALMNSAKELDAEIDKINKDPLNAPMQLAAPADIAKNPNWAATARQLASLHSQRAVYANAAAGVVSGKIDPDAVQGTVAQQLKAADTTKPAAPPAAGKADIQGMAGAIKSGKATIAQAQALVKAGRLSQDDFTALQSLLGTP